MSISLRATMRSSRLFVAVCAALSMALLSPAVIAADAGASADAEPPAKLLDKVEVHGERDAAERERAMTPGAVTIVDAESFRARAVDTLADSLRYVPGVFTNSGTGGDAVFITSRGSNLDATDYDSNGIKLLQDGLPVSTADGNNHNRFVDPMASRAITVAHGANALTFGASTLGGAIDFTSATARNSTARELFVDGGSDGALSGRLTLGGVHDELDGLLSIESKSRDGYRAHSAQERHSAYANAGWQATPNLDVRVFATHIDNHEQLAGALTRAQFDADPTQANPSAITGNFQLNVRTDRLAGKGVWHVDNSRRLEFGLSFEDQNLYHPIVDKILVDFDGPGPNPPVEVFSLLKNTDQRTAAGMIRYGMQAGDHDVLLGLNAARTHETGGNFRNDGGRRNGQTGIIDNRSDSAELFLVDRWTIAPGWTLVYGAQGVRTGRDVRSTDLASGRVSNPKRDYTSINPRLGVLHALTPTSEAFASVSRLFEAPTTFELTDDVHGNNTTLDPMQGTVIEAGLRGATAVSSQGPQWHWDAAIYYARIRDEILSVDSPVAPGTSLSTNIDRTTHAGLEALVGASLPVGDSGRIEPTVSATYNRFMFDGDATYGDNRLPAAPTYAVRGEVLYRHRSGVFAGPTFDWIGGRYADFSNTYRLGAYQLLGLRAGIARDRWEAFVEARNLTDEHYVGTLSVRDRADPNAAILQPGAPRSVYAGVRFTF